MPDLVTWPDTPAFKFETFDAQLVPTVRASPSIINQQVQTYETPWPYWRFVATLPPQLQADRAAVEALLVSLRGSVNRVSMWHHARPLPRGSRQTNSTTNAARVAGEKVVSFNATTGQTILAGDLLNVALQSPAVTPALVMATADATAVANVLTVPITPLRGAVAVGAAVTVVRPTARCILREPATVPYRGGYSERITLEFIEVFS